MELNHKNHKPLWAAIEIMHSNAMQNIEICDSQSDKVELVCEAIAEIPQADLAGCFYDNNPDAIMLRLLESGISKPTAQQICDVIECSEAEG